jgi:hypothetical protein
VLTCILAEDRLGDSLVSEVIDTCQETDVNLKEFGRRYLTALSFKPLQINRKKIHFAGIWTNQEKSAFPAQLKMRQNNKSLIDVIYG